jgi:anaerobic selenocysteine-containing dehydrogenase
MHVNDAAVRNITDCDTVWVGSPHGHISLTVILTGVPVRVERIPASVAG